MGLKGNTGRNACATVFNGAENANLRVMSRIDVLMLTFEQFLRNTAEKGGSINTLFEERLFALVGTLEKIAGPLTAERIPYELIGGGAVMVQVNRVEPSAVRNTKDIDIMVHRSDLDRINEVAQRHAFKFRHAPSYFPAQN